MKWTVRILQGLLAVGFLLFGFMKVSANPMQVQAFTNVYGYGTGFMYVVGAIEIISAIGLLIGYWKNSLVPVFSGILTITMAGAVFTHLNSGQGFGVALTPFILLVLAVVVFFSQRKMINKNSLEGLKL
ncbi:DoxX family protein [Bacillus sp. E214]|uniref:DoxX family protein n=1 Tax=Bacillus sp. E214 TaxID=2587156 RepID=UPI0011DF52F8|nr:DoxX family protein [Bacillus sp. E214]